MQNLFSKMSKNDKVESMTIICNIQMMMKKINNRELDFSFFACYSLTELRTMQDKTIIEYNKTFKN